LFMQKPEQAESYVQWLTFAEYDLEVAKIILKKDRCIPPAIFHTQQCGEKALKAFLAFHKQKHVKIHDLVKLLRLCSRIDATFMQLLPYAKSLNPFLTKTRYPDELFFMPSLDTLKISINEAEHILNFVKERINVS